MAKLLVRARYDYIQGHLRYGYAEAEVDKDEWEKMTPGEQKEYLSDVGEIVDINYEIDDMGDLGEIEVKGEINE